MIFKIKWGDFVKHFGKRVMVSEPGQETPIKFYFEDEKSILAFIQTRGITLCSEINFDLVDGKEIKQLKMEYFSDAIELTENPLQQRLGALVAQY